MDERSRPELGVIAMLCQSRCYDPDVRHNQRRNAHENSLILLLLLGFAAFIRAIPTTAASVEHENARVDRWNFVVFHDGVLQLFKPNTE